MKRAASFILCAGLAAALFGGCGAAPSAEAVAVETSAAGRENVTPDATIFFDGGGISVSGDGVKSGDEGEVRIKQSGTYLISGASDPARVVVDAEGASVTLILGGCDLTCGDDEALYIKSAVSAEVVLAAGTENTLTSGVYTGPAGEGTADEDGGETEDASGAALRAKCPLTIRGGGALTVYGYINNGIASSDSLTVEDGVIAVTAVNDALKSKSDLLISGGDLTLTAAQDGVQADGELTVSGGSLRVTTGAGADGADMKVSDSLMMGGFGSGEMRDMRDRWDADSSDTGSRKGLKAGTAVTITGGTITLDTEDDAIHSDGGVVISGGALAIRSGDDGVHGDTSLTVSGGSVDVAYCYEGLEAGAVTITGGEVRIVATDDGVNVNGGSFGGFGSGEASAGADGGEDATPVLRITGGTVVVDSGGDGLDSNGDIYIEGGTVCVSGPSSDWDAAIDYGDRGCEFVISGGTVMAAGYSGMMEAPDAADGAQPAILYTASGYCQDGDTVTLTDEDGNVVAQYAFAHGFNCVLISSPRLTVGDSYTLVMGQLEPVTVELSDTVYSNRTRGGGMPGFGGGGPGRDASREASGEN